MEALKAGPREQQRAAESTSREEVEWFYRFANGAIPRAGESSLAARRTAVAIQGWLKEIPTFHAGALSLRFTRREWPASIQVALGEWTSLIVRLDCAGHPSDGSVSTADLETAAVHRLEKMLAASKHVEIAELEERAERHVRAAIRAYVKVRGFGPTVLPAAAVKQ